MGDLLSSDYEAMVGIAGALHSSLDLRVSMARAIPLLQCLVGADHAALGVSRAGTLYDYEWYHVSLPESFLGAYDRIRERDFVRIAVAARPNEVLRDEQMLSRKQMERHLTYQHAHETADIEQVMAVMVAYEREWSSGLSLYRTKRRPFTLREAALLQKVVPQITHAVRNCREHAALRRGGWLEPAVQHVGVGVIWLDMQGSEVTRTPRASQLLEHFFSPHERRLGKLPDPLLDYWRQVRAVTVNEAPPDPWTRETLLSSLHVSVVALSEYGMWALAMRTRGLDPALAARLSPRRARIAAYVLRGLSSQEIADREHRALATVKQQIEEVCKALGASGRKGLLRLASGLDRMPDDP